MTEQEMIDEKTCEKCLHYRACLINSEYFPESPCCVFDRKSEWTKQTEGEWETGLQTCSYLSGTDAEYCCKCNVCGGFAVDAFAYCPECGAKMKGGYI